MPLAIKQPKVVKQASTGRPQQHFLKPIIKKAKAEATAKALQTYKQNKLLEGYKEENNKLIKRTNQGKTTLIEEQTIDPQTLKINITTREEKNLPPNWKTIKKINSTLNDLNKYAGKMSMKSWFKRQDKLQGELNKELSLYNTPKSWLKQSRVSWMKQPEIKHLKVEIGVTDKETKTSRPYNPYTDYNKLQSTQKEGVIKDESNKLSNRIPDRETFSNNNNNYSDNIYYEAKSERKKVERAEFIRRATIHLKKILKEEGNIEEKITKTEELKAIIKTIQESITDETLEYERMIKVNKLYNEKYEEK